LAFFHVADPGPQRQGKKSGPAASSAAGPREQLYVTTGRLVLTFFSEI
jgi:hypothetical protein